MKDEVRRMEGEMSKILHANHRRDIEHAMSKKITSRMMRMNVKKGGSRDLYIGIEHRKIYKSDQLDLTKTMWMNLSRGQTNDPGPSDKYQTNKQTLD